MAKARVPGPTNTIGIGWCGPTIIAFGTEEQKKRFLQPMLKADEIWCQGFSEPEAGSDLANCQTKGVQDGDYWVVNGQKVWTSGGHYSDWAILIVRTEPTAPKHRGLSFFLLDMHAPGVTVRPLRQMTGGAEFNETFMDNVRIHKSMQVGERGPRFLRGDGHTGVRAVRHRRGNRPRKHYPGNGRSLPKDMRREKQGDPLGVRKSRNILCEGNAIKYTGLRALSRQLSGIKPPSRGWSHELFRHGMEPARQRVRHPQFQGPYSRLMRDSKYAYNDGRWQHGFLQ